MPVAVPVVTLLLVLLFTAAGVGKVAGLAQSVGIRDHVAMPPPLWRGIGVLELSAAAGLLVGLAVPPVTVITATGLALLSIGAIGTHVRARDGAVHSLPAVAALILAVSLITLTVVR
jgi:uncharacterized membrane protein YphA (DoxX/SURF4 family)